MKRVEKERREAHLFGRRDAIILYREERKKTERYEGGMRKRRGDGEV